MEILFLLILAAMIWLAIKHKRLKTELSQKTDELNNLTQNYQQYRRETEHLKQYAVIDNAKAEAAVIVEQAVAQREQTDQQCQLKQQVADEAAQQILTEAKNKAKQTQSQSEALLSEAHLMARKIENEALANAELIAGKAWKAQGEAELYEATVKAMKNKIKGYGDEYLIPNETLLDDLADAYDHQQAGQELKLIREQIKSMIKHDEAAVCDYVEVHRKTTAINFVVDAFNGKVDTIMARVKHDNYGKLKQKLDDAFTLVNHNGKAFRNARITDRYHILMAQQLETAVKVQELKRQDQEEQRLIREAMREEERARKEYEKARKEAEKEERILQKALREAEAKLASAVAEEKQAFEEQLKLLQEKLQEAEAKGQRALSMAQQTKQGHVYVISNIGSFGENVFKIGLTRRLEPMDRVKELGDASVPFSFDVHAMIFSEDAPKLEKELHTTFFKNQLNKVNPRKEFFKIPLSEIRAEIEKTGMNTHWTMKAEALEYRESLQLAQRENVSTFDRSGVGSSVKV